MSDGYDGYAYELGVVLESTTSHPILGHTLEINFPYVTTIFVMRAVDANCPTLTYRSWIVYDDPDFNVEKYNGNYCGASINFTDVTVVYQKSSLD